MNTDFSTEWRNQLPSWLERFGPQLWKHRQHSPRPLHLPAHYAKEVAPPNAPTIAIVTPSHNQGRYLPATINSVLNQDYPRLNYIVQDGASTDGTRGVLKSYGTKLCWRSEVDTGQGNAINMGFSRISGELMAYLNSDDILLPGTLAYIARASQTYPDVDIFYGHRIYIDERGLEIGRWVTAPHDPKATVWSDVIPQETLFWRRRVWDAVGKFDESFRFALDWDFILRAQGKGFKFRRLPRFLACFRVHDQQKTTRMMNVNDEEVRRLRTLYLGRNPTEAEMHQALRPYFIRHILLHQMHRLGILRH